MVFNDISSRIPDSPDIDSRKAIELSCQFAMACLKLTVSVVPSAALGLHALYDVLPECIVGTPLGRSAVDVPPAWVCGPGIAVPLLDGVGWIGQEHTELHTPVDFDKGGMGQGTYPDHTEVLDAMQKQIHPTDGIGKQIALLAKQPEVAPLLVLPRCGHN